MYTDRVMQEFREPKNIGEMPDANGIGTVGNASCGDIMKMFLRIENGVIVKASFLTFGCAAAIATSSVATTMLKGMTVEQALKLTNKMVIEELGGLPPHKIHCSVLAEEAVQLAIADYKARLSSQE